MHRVFCATAWELEGERRAFYDVLGEFNEREAMPHGILYVPVSLTNVRDKRPYQFTVEENLRDSRHYILAITDGWGPPERNFQRDFQLASAGGLRPALLVRRPSTFTAQLAADGFTPVEFDTTEDFCRIVRGLLTQWLAAELNQTGKAAVS